MQHGVTFPVIASAISDNGNPERDADPAAQPGKSGGVLRVVVVEDEPFVRLDIESALMAAGHKVVAIADTADEAVKLADRERPDLMVMDIRLIGPRDGVDAAVEIWERFGIRSVFASANLDPTTRARANRANPLGFVDKPFVSGTLLAAIAKKQ